MVRWLELQGKWVDADSVQSITREAVEDYSYSSPTLRPEVARLHCIGGLTVDIPLQPSDEVVGGLIVQMVNQEPPQHCDQITWRLPARPPRRMKARIGYERDIRKQQENQECWEYRRLYFAEWNELLGPWRDARYAEICAEVQAP